jgi:hypothetical protein
VTYLSSKLVYADEYTNLNAAHDAAQASGSTLILGPREYVLDEPLYVTTDTTIIGQPESLINAFGQEATIIYEGGTPYHTIILQDIRIKFGGRGIWIKQNVNQNSAFTNVHVSQTTVAAMECNASIIGTRWDSFQANNPGEYGWLMRSTETLRGSANVCGVYNSRVNGATKAGFACVDASGDTDPFCLATNFFSCTAEYNDDNADTCGFLFETTKANMYGCWIENNSIGVLARSLVATTGNTNRTEILIDSAYWGGVEERKVRLEGQWVNLRMTNILTPNVIIERTNNSQQVWYDGWNSPTMQGQDTFQKTYITAKNQWQQPFAQIVNGGFDTDTEWTKNSPWVITGGQAVNDGTNGYQAIMQPYKFNIGDTYAVTWTQSGWVGGLAARPISSDASSGNGNQTLGLTQTGDGQKTINITPADSNVWVGIQSNGMTIDDVSIAVV